MQKSIEFSLFVSVKFIYLLHVFSHFHFNVFCCNLTKSERLKVLHLDEMLFCLLFIKVDWKFPSILPAPSPLPLFSPIPKYN